MAEVYVGTYKKYNNGSLDGAWLKLEDYASYKDFVEACRKLHKDEKDPELMIQDTSEMPDGLNCGEWLDEEEFNDIITAIKESESEESEEQSKFQIIDYSEKAIAVIGDTREIKDELKKLGGKFNPRLSCGAGWIFSKKVQGALEGLLGGKITNISSSQSKAVTSEYKACFEEYLKTLNLPSDVKYTKQYYIGAMKINDKYMLIGKDSIENSFWLSDEGDEYEFYKKLYNNEELKKEYFISCNLRGVERDIKVLRNDFEKVYISDESIKVDCNRVYWYSPSNRWQKNREVDVEATMEQREEIAKALEWKKAQFEKRLENYLKRYGTSKMRIGTYWRDR